MKVPGNIGHSILRKMGTRVIIPGITIIIVFSSFLLWREGSIRLQENKNLLASVEIIVQSYLDGADRILNVPRDLSPTDPAFETVIHSMVNDRHPFSRVAYVDGDDIIRLIEPSGVPNIGFPVNLLRRQEETLSPSMAISGGCIVMYTINHRPDGGMLIGELDLSLIHRDILDAIQKGTGEILITDSYGNLISHHNMTLVNQQVNLGAETFFNRNSESWFKGFFSYDGESFWGIERIMARNGWHILLYVPAHYALSRMLAGGIIIPLMYSILLLALMYVFSRELQSNILTPMETLSLDIQNLGLRGPASPMSYAYRYGTYNEIRDLGNHITQAGSRISKRTEILELSNQKLENMIREVHHRTKNNLNSVIGLLSIQHQMLDNEQCSMQLAVALNRMQTVSRLHELLHSSGNLESIPMRVYLGNIVQAAMETVRNDKLSITIRQHVGDVIFSSDAAMKTGMVFNELITNSMKHAFPDHREGEIHIGLQNTGAQNYIMSYRDNGVGKNNTHDTGLGMRLINSILTEQFSGVVETGSAGGFFLNCNFTLV